MARGLVPAVFLCAFALQPASALAVPGQLTQLAGTEGCVSDTGSGGECADGREMTDALSVTVSPDGKSVYTAALTTVVIFERNLNSGAISQLMGTAGCYSNDGSGGECSDGTAIGGEGSTVVSPDGKHVYAAGQNADAVSAFSRDATTGALTQLPGAAACVSESGSGGDCVDGRGLDGARVLAISPDGLNVYVPSVFSDAIAVFRRDASTGALTQLAGTAGCVSDDGSAGECVDVNALNTPFTVTVSADGRHVYAAVDDSDAVTAFERDASTGALTQLAGTAACVSDTGSGGQCANGRGLNSARGVAASPDGKSIYVGSNQPGGLAILTRDPGSGALTQVADPAGCISDNGSAGECVDGRALGGGHGVAVSPDNLNVYLAADDGNSVSTFARDQGSGGLTQLAGTAGCTSSDGSGGECVDGRGLADAEFVTVSPDCRNIYTAAEADSAVAAFAREAPQACPVQTTPSLAVAKAVSAATATRGNDVQFTVTVSNTGTADAQAVTLEDPLAAGLTFKSATPSAGSCSATGGTVSCQLGTVAAGASVRVEIIVTAAECGVVTNTASVSSTPGDGSPSDNQGSAKVDVNQNCPVDRQPKKEEDEEPVPDREDDDREEAGAGEGAHPLTGFALLALAAIGSVALVGGAAVRRLTRPTGGSPADEPVAEHEVVQGDGAGAGKSSDPVTGRGVIVLAAVGTAALLAGAVVRRLSRR